MSFLPADQQVPREKGRLAMKDYERRLKEVLAEVKVKNGRRPSEPAVISLRGIWDPIEFVHLAGGLYKEDKYAFEERKAKIVYPYPSMIITNVPLSERTLRDLRGRWQDYEQCNQGEEGIILGECGENQSLALAIKAKDPAKGITFGEIMAEMQAYEHGHMCGFDTDARESVSCARREFCGRYRLEYTRDYVYYGSFDLLD
ncbi:unnamed protein product [Vitrella brassicaformis CCMP3155]|uniref:Uncharacterized protein n=1 Tax=Vitrella brassicaformis (strain CCMP3155) TaxID=1169540 RepID=A0A0G4GGB8_VITBC|nr:unnamed protein product [Vitrella brassicaformis CCMP3155]|mmetsp:Transcript_8018/g.19753  ORF Transcript_8018/g.19753 Transcript_8018/m.19753 type:complete len:201 (-) Transcript_8018:431-1033(-)|eukprot:CEM28665.1 unnamed protein product [Vitrella brassicaformis CCMP3155]